MITVAFFFLGAFLGFATAALFMAVPVERNKDDEFWALKADYGKLADENWRLKMQIQKHINDTIDELTKPRP